MQYEQKKDEDNENKEFLQDFTLKPLPPFYPDGMMHFEVLTVTRGGIAEDFNVKKGFRLLAITKKDGTTDERDFRDKEQYEAKKAEMESQIDPMGDVQAQRVTPSKVILGESQVPLTLVFEGNIKSMSWECLGHLIFLFSFLSFILQASRIEDCFSLNNAHRTNIVNPEWYDLGPTRSTSFESISDMRTMEAWMNNALVPEMYKCYETFGSKECKPFDDEGIRPGWKLWSGLGGNQSLPAGVSTAECPATPNAASGMSLGNIT